jgi:hypothetical protein
LQVKRGTCQVKKEYTKSKGHIDSIEVFFFSFVLFFIYYFLRIWDATGESFAYREKTHNDLEHECVEAHRRRLNKASHLSAHLRRSIADAEANLAAICSAMGERPVSNAQVLLSETS